MASAASKTGATSITTPSDTEVLVTRVVDAPQQLAWDCFTKPEHVRQWLLGPPGWTMPVCEIDLRAGGAWRYVYSKGDGTDPHGSMTLSGTYQEVTPIDRIVTTESWGPEWPATTNTLRLIPSGEQTTITITIKYGSKDARDAALKTAMSDGMESGFKRLDELLSTLA